MGDEAFYGILNVGTLTTKQIYLIQEWKLCVEQCRSEEGSSGVDRNQSLLPQVPSCYSIGTEDSFN